uniref:Sarcoplasmic calcium-binding protein n=1 Tax=Cacopsylla melanoneura TaxID=428564 RepID=A0A8D8YGQ4_9HEMI
MSHGNRLKLVSSTVSKIVCKRSTTHYRRILQNQIVRTYICPSSSIVLFRLFSSTQIHHNTISKTFDKQQAQDESDSDDEDDHFSHTRGESEFWRRKMRTIHRILDVNKDGVIAFDDMRIFAERFIELGHLSENHQKEFHSVLKTMWEEHFGSLDQYNLVSIHQYLEIMHHSLNDPKLRKKVHHFLPYLFKAVDKDGDRIISLEEFKLFFKCLGLPSEAAIVSFSVIDENTDNKLSLREFVKLGREYFLTENQKLASKMLWGPLAD